MERFIRKLPKAELHLHIEGSLEPELMLELAERNKIDLDYKDVDEIRKAYDFQNLQSFLDIYYAGARVLLHPQDFYDLTWAYLDRVHKENVKHVEIFFDPQTHTDRGISFSDVVDGIHSALREGERKLKISFKLIMCYLRHLDEAAAYETLQMALPHKDKIAGVGLDSSEQDNPPEKFKGVFKASMEAGFRTVAHAGEEGPPEYIWNALKFLKVSRIDHGVRCVEDPALVVYLKEHRTPLTVCPLSNVRLRVFDKLADHNLKALLNAGLVAMLNSDDPAYFGGYVEKNYVDCQRTLQLSEDDLVLLSKNSFEASWLPEEQKQGYYRDADALRGTSSDS